eukprot:162936_1
MLHYHRQFKSLSNMLSNQSKNKSKIGCGIIAISLLTVVVVVMIIIVSTPNYSNWEYYDLLMSYCSCNYTKALIDELLNRQFDSDATKQAFKTHPRGVRKFIATHNQEIINR